MNTEKKRRHLILVGAGKGERLGYEQPKALVPLVGSTILSRVLRQFLEVPDITETIITYPAGFQESFQKELPLESHYHLVEGGQTRQESVKIALDELSSMVRSSPTDLVAVHDVARCLVSPVTVEAAYTAAEGAGAVTVALPQAETLKRVDPENLQVVETLSREDIWRIQTPQVFSFKLLVDAHKQAESHDGEELAATDDASLVERLAPVTVVSGDERNIKITTPSDLELARSILAG